MNIHLNREVCGCCKKSILYGQSIMECVKCSSIIHSKCFKRSKFFNAKICSDCDPCDLPLYNPFSELSDITDSDDPHTYGPGLSDAAHTIQAAANILSGCKACSTAECVDLLQKHGKNKLSSVFFNLDGNRSNFDLVAAELSAFQGAVSIIGLAETNTDPSMQSLYPLDGYTSYYQETMPGKSKGTGVALYIHNSLNATVNNLLSKTSGNMESLFVSFMIHGGVIYRPPCGDKAAFIDEFSSLNSLIAEGFTQILGDYNIDLLDRNNTVTQQFEEAFLGHGFFPLISTITHKRANSAGSCIDNILTNRLRDITHTGKICDWQSAHSPIYCISDTTVETDHKNTPNIQYYSFKKDNIDHLAKSLCDNSEGLTGPDPDNPDFSHFLSAFGEAMDASCKLSKPKVSKRTPISNPWITDGIETSVDTKSQFYKEWKKSCCKKQPRGNQTLYTRFNEYRRCLKAVIKSAKSTFFGTKFENSMGDPKKHGSS